MRKYYSEHVFYLKNAPGVARSEPFGLDLRLGTGRSCTDTLCGPSKTTAFMVFCAISLQGARF